jgi:predicted ATPase
VSLRILSKSVEFRKFWVRNFKSLRDVTLDIPSKLTVVIGANGSGKTALVEAFELLIDILEWSRGRVINPFTKWWGYNKIVWSHNEDLPITLGLELKLEKIDKHQELGGEALKYIIESLSTKTPMEIIYEIDITGKGGDLHILREKLSIHSKELNISIDNVRKTLDVVADISIALDRLTEVLEQHRGRWEKAKDSGKLLNIDSLLRSIIFGVAPSILRRYVSEDLLGRVKSELLLSALLRVPHIINIPSTNVEFQIRTVERYSVLEAFTEVEEDVKSDVVDPGYSVFDYILGDVVGELGFKSLARFIGERISFNTGSPEYQEVIAEVLKGGGDVDEVFNTLKDLVSLLIAGGLLERIADYLVDASTVVFSFVDGVCVIRDIDWRVLRSAQDLTRQERLRYDASNFVSFLFTITGGNVGEGLEEALRYAFPGSEKVRVVFDVTTDGRVFIKLISDTAQVTPPSIPSGVLKTLIIESLLLWRPTLIVIDEFENSLHPELQQFLMDEFRGSDVYTIITTHSTVPLDYVKDVREVVVLKLEGGETKLYRLGEEEGRRLRESKLTLSELIHSKLLRI